MRYKSKIDHENLKKHDYHQYKMKFVQELSEDDFDRRIEFCEEMMRRYDGNHQFFNWICFSDEATFELNGSVNRHLRYWADNNPHWIRDCHTQYPQKLNVWARIIGHHIKTVFYQMEYKCTQLRALTKNRSRAMYSKHYRKCF